MAGSDEDRGGRERRCKIGLINKAKEERKKRKKRHDVGTLSTYSRKEMVAQGHQHKWAGEIGRLQSDNTGGL